MEPNNIANPFIHQNIFKCVSIIKNWKNMDIYLGTKYEQRTGNSNVIKRKFTCIK